MRRCGDRSRSVSGRRAVKNPNPEFENFLEALIERHRMPAIFRIRTEFERLFDKANKLLPVQVTSAVELDRQTVEDLGKRIGEQTGNEIELSSKVDPDILGGIVLRVGNFILDASIRTRLEVGLIMRLIMRSEVVLPQPDGPTSTVSLPVGSSSETWSTAVPPPG